MIGELAALGAAISWTISAILYRKALSVVKPISANIVRCACTSLVLVVCLIVIGKFEILTNLSTFAVVLSCASGIIGLGLGDTLYMVSLKLIGVARAVPITCTYPLFSLLLTVFLQGKEVALQVFFGAAVIVFGVWLLTREDEKGSQGTVSLKGVVAALATAVIWSISIAMIDVAVTLPEVGSFDGALAVNTIRVLGVAGTLLILSPMLDKQLSFLKMPKKTLVFLILAGVVALALGWFLLAYSFLQIPEARAVPISSTSPLFANIVGVVLLHEKITARNVFGSIIIVLGIFLIFIRQ